MERVTMVGSSISGVAVALVDWLVLLQALHVLSVETGEDENATVWLDSELSTRLTSSPVVIGRVIFGSKKMKQNNRQLLKSKMLPPNNMLLSRD